MWILVLFHPKQKNVHIPDSSITVILHVVVRLRHVTVILASPFETPTTNPLSSTVATDGLSDDHIKLDPIEYIALPF